MSVREPEPRQVSEDDFVEPFPDDPGRPPSALRPEWLSHEGLEPDCDLAVVEAVHSL